MQTLFFIAGIIVLALTAVDVIWTTLLLVGEGPLSRMTGRFLSTIARRLDCLSHAGRTLLGPMVLMGVTLSWLLLLWAGWTLVFLGARSAVADTDTLDPGGFWDRVYTAGYMLITLGVGDFRPMNPLHQVLSVVAAISGFALVTLTMTFLLGLVGQVVNQRAAAQYILGLGGSAQEIVLRAWNGRSFSELSQHLPGVTTMLLQVSEQYYSRPLLHHFRGPTRHRSLPVSLVHLDDALTILSHGVSESARLNDAILKPLRSAIDRCLEVVERNLPLESVAPPPAPGLEALRQQGVPLVSDDVFEAALRTQHERRQRLQAYVRWDGGASAAADH
jgi:hypothetical protein